MRGLPDRVREQQAVFGRTGGVHAAALATADGELLVVREDVGRHNAVDKVTGARVLGGAPPAEACLVVSGRAGFELVQKAVAAGIGSLVAVGAPTSLSVRLARESGLALYGFTSPNVACATPDYPVMALRRGCVVVSVVPPSVTLCASSTPPTGISGGPSTGRACSRTRLPTSTTCSTWSPPSGSTWWWSPATSTTARCPTSTPSAWPTTPWPGSRRRGPRS